jgi:hypothetical protein
MNVADAWVMEDPTRCEVCGRDACEDHLPAEPASSSSKRPRLHAQRALDVLTTPRPKEIVEGIAWGGCVTVLVSESGTGKTFVLLDLAGAVSDGVPWHGRAVREGSVVYLSYEGDALGLRLRALRDVSGRRLEHLYIVRGSDPLSPRANREGEDCSVGELAVAAALESLTVELATARRPPISLIVIDTVRASLSGSEDSSEHVAAYLRAVRRVMARVPGTAAILAHHAGWQDGEQQRKRERGSSAWRGNCDGTLYLEAGEYDAERGETALTLRALKVRDAERPAPMHLFRRRVEIAERIADDIRRGPVTSCVIDSDRRSREDREAAQAAAAETETRAIDQRLLRVIAERPDSATSQDRLRVAVGLRRDLVQAAVVRLLDRGWIELPARQRQPYTVTVQGLSELSGSATV